MLQNFNNVLVTVPSIHHMDKARLKNVKISLPLHREGLTSYLSPILGQYGIRNTEFLSAFIEKFHAQTDNILKNIFSTDRPEEQGFLEEPFVVPVYLYVYKAGKFDLSVNWPNITFFIKSHFFKRIRRLRKKHVNVRNVRKLVSLLLVAGEESRISFNLPVIAGAAVPFRADDVSNKTQFSLTTVNRTVTNFFYLPFYKSLRSSVFKNKNKLFRQ